jgi:ABC-type transporter MlaC component
MSKTTLASLQTQVTELTVQFAALSARLDSLAAPVAPATPAKKAKKASKPKDPDAPKKPLSSYLVFSAAKRAEVPEGGAKLTAKILAEQWKALTPEQQAAYKPVAVAVAVAPVAVAEGAKPKRPLNAFMRFTVARRAEAPDTKLTSKALGEEWKALSADQQAAYKTPPVSDAESSDDDDGADTSDAE